MPDLSAALKMTSCLATRAFGDNKVAKLVDFFDVK
jgi:hypothetical protein